MLISMSLQTSLTLASLLLHWLCQLKSPWQRRMLQVQSTGVGSPRGDWWEKQKLPHVLRAAQVTYRSMSSKRQMKLSGNSGAQPPPRTALFVCISLLDWESTDVLFPCSFQRADQGPGVEPWPSHCQWAVSADNKGLPRTGKGRKAKQSFHHTSYLLHMSSSLMSPNSARHHSLSVWWIPLSKLWMTTLYCALKPQIWTNCKVLDFHAFKSGTWLIWKSYLIK